MRAVPEASVAPASPAPEASVASPSPVPEASVTGAGPIRLAPHVSAAEALAVLRRRLPQATGDVELHHHPFWWVQAEVRGARMHVLVDAVSGTGYISHFDPGRQQQAQPATTSGAGTQPATASGTAAPALPPPQISPAEAERVAHRLVATFARRKVKLAPRLDLRIVAAARLVAKPNWLVTGGNDAYQLRMLVDGLDGSHYVISAEAQRPARA